MPPAPASGRPSRGAGRTPRSTRRLDLVALDDPSGDRLGPAALPGVHQRGEPAVVGAAVVVHEDQQAVVPGRGRGQRCAPPPARAAARGRSAPGAVQSGGRASDHARRPTAGVVVHHGHRDRVVAGGSSSAFCASSSGSSSRRSSLRWNVGMPMNGRAERTRDGTPSVESRGQVVARLLPPAYDAPVTGRVGTAPEAGGPVPAT